MRIKILLFGGEADSRQFATILKDDEIEIVGSVADENSVLEEISRTSADIVLITDTSPMSLRACQQIYLLRPRSIPIVLLDKDDNEILQGVLSTGVHNILYKEMEPIHLVSEIKGIYANESNRLLSIETTSVSSNKSKVILVYGTKGGIGKSSVAVNLALKLSENRNKVAILDYNFQFGCVGTLMGLSGRNTISELIQEQMNLNADLIRQFLTLHSSGANVLLAPNNPEDGATITSAQADRIIAALRVYYDYVIIDTAPVLDDITTVCFDSASNILYLVKPNIASIKNTKKGLEVVDVLANPEKIKLVVCGDLTGKIKEGDITKVLSRPIWHAVRNDEKLATDAINQGIPYVLSYPKSKLSGDIEQLAIKLDGTDGPLSNKKSKRIRKSKK